MSLNNDLEFDHVVRIGADGSVSDVAGIYAPSLYHDDDADVIIDGDGWELLTGYTGQYGYHGAVLHPSEYIGGALERDILAHPGVYVVCAVECESTDDDPEPEPAGWAVARWIGAQS